MDVGNAAQVKEQKITKKMFRDQELAELKDLLSLYHFRTFIWRVLTWSGVYKLSFVQDSESLTNFKEGSRNIGLMLLAECFESDPQAYIQMQKEAQERESKREGSL